MTGSSGQVDRGDPVQGILTRLSVRNEQWGGDLDLAALLRERPLGLGVLLSLIGGWRLSTGCEGRLGIETDAVRTLLKMGPANLAERGCLGLSLRRAKEILPQGKFDGPR